MSTSLCVVCGKPTADGYACSRCAGNASEQLAEIADLAPIARDVALGLIRRGNGGNGGSGKADSRSPLDFDASERLDAVQNTLTTLARDIAEAAQIEFAGPTPADPLRWACSWLTDRMAWLRGALDGHEPRAIRTFDEIDACARDMRRLTEGPPERELVGMCDCGKVLYAPYGRSAVTCSVPTCKLRWEVAESRDILRRALDGKLVTASEAARLGAYLDTDRSQEQIRKLINAWSSRGMVLAHGQVDGEPTFRFGDVADRLAATPRRNREGAAA